MKKNLLSEKEQKLFKFIKKQKNVSIRIIEDTLGASFVGALGRLVGQKLVESHKLRVDDMSSVRFVKYYKVK